MNGLLLDTVKMDYLTLPVDTGIQPPFFANQLKPHLAIALDQLCARTRTEITEEDKRLAVELLIETSCEIIDTGLLALLDDLSAKNPALDFAEMREKAEEVKAKAHRYMRWASGYIAKDRLTPVIGHYQTLIHRLDLGNRPHYYLAFNISAAFAADLQRGLSTLADGNMDALDDVIALMVQALEETMNELLIKPKDLMQLSFVVDKTLNGVLSLVISLYKHVLRKTIRKLPRESFPHIASHLSTFLIV